MPDDEKSKKISAQSAAALKKIHPDEIDPAAGVANPFLTRQAAAEEDLGPLVRCVVGRGRTIDVPVPDEKKQVGWNDKGEAVFATRQERFGPGAEIELPAKEVLRLQQLGFLHDPSKIAPAEEYTGPNGSIKRD